VAILDFRVFLIANKIEIGLDASEEPFLAGPQERLVSKIGYTELTRPSRADLVSLPMGVSPVS